MSLERTSDNPRITTNARLRELPFAVGVALSALLIGLYARLPDLRPWSLRA